MGPSREEGRVPPETLDRAFAVFEDFGPNRLIDRRERLRMELGLRGPGEVETVMRAMEGITRTMWRLARRGGEIKLGQDTVRETLRREHPFLEGPGLDKAVFLINYLAWHEGFDH